MGGRLSGWPEKARHEGAWEVCLGRAWGPPVPPQSPRGPRSTGKRCSVVPHKGTRGLEEAGMSTTVRRPKETTTPSSTAGEANHPLRSTPTHRPQHDGHREPSNHRPGISQLALPLPAPAPQNDKKRKRSVRIVLRFKPIAAALCGESAGCPMSGPAK